MFQLPVNNLTRIRKARKQVKKALEDIGLEYCKEVAEEFKDFCPDEEFVKGTQGFDICSWDPSYSKTQEYRSKPFCCLECPFSSKYYSGYKNHFRNVHRKLLDGRILLNCPYCSFTASKRTLEAHVKIFHTPGSGQQNYGGSQGTVIGAKTNHTNALQKMQKSMYFCKKCTFRDSLYNVVRRHIYREHFQHIVSPYLGMVSDSSVKNGTSSINGNNIFCKQCQFTTRIYEALVQHVLEYHERIGSHVTNMIGHANVMVPASQAPPAIIQKAPVVSRGNIPRSNSVSHPVIGYLKPIAPAIKSQPTIQASPVYTLAAVKSPVAENNSTAINTNQTQKWKICTVCNELFPENLYSAHFENAHKAKKVWAMAKYIMKIHNFTSKCLLCNRYLPSSTLLNHMLTHGVTCPQCHLSFHGVHQLMEHTAKTHPNEFIGPVDASPLTFDLTIKQGQSRNIQLTVLTFNMKDSFNGQDQSALALQNVSALPSPPSVRVPPVKLMNKYSEPKGLVSLFHSSGGGKVVCPLCFSILKDPASNALAMHLRERHQVLQTMHPVEKRMTYKCIHCLGVYTSNMVASTITLHLVQCRAVGRNQASQGLKSTLTPKLLGVGTLKRQLPIQATTTPTPKKVKVSKTCGSNHKVDGLVLDPTGYELKTHEIRKKFLTTYFNHRPYPTPDEEVKLSENLMMWRSDVAGHFISKRNICFRSFKFKKAAVRLGFNMHALNELKHDLVLDKERSFSTPTMRSASPKSVTQHTKQQTDSEPKNTLKLNTCSETISIDSDSEEETRKPNDENVESKNPTEVARVDTSDPSAGTNSCQEENTSPTPENGESVDEKETTEETNVDTNDSLTEKSSCQEGTENVGMVQTTKNVESKDQEILTKETGVDTTDNSFQEGKENVFVAPTDEVVESKDRGDLMEDASVDTNDILPELSFHEGQENVFMALTDNLESNDQVNLMEDTNMDSNYPSTELCFQEGQEDVFMALTGENVVSKDQENLMEDATMDTNYLSPELSFQEGHENVFMSSTDENMEFKDQENLIDAANMDTHDLSVEPSSCQDGKENVCLASY